jgi:hypothetical protein
MLCYHLQQELLSYGPAVVLGCCVLASLAIRVVWMLVRS